MSDLTPEKLIEAMKLMQDDTVPEVLMIVCGVCGIKSPTVLIGAVDLITGKEKRPNLCYECFKEWEGK